MVKPDDSSLNQESLLVVERRALEMLNKADVWNRFPTPVDDVLAAAKLKVALRSNIFDPATLAAYLKQKAKEAGKTLKSAISKVFGIYDAEEEIIHIDSSVTNSKQTFLKLHETGHHQIPAHKRTFKLFQECPETLSPEIADQFEREANNFAKIVLFQGDTFARLAADMRSEIKTPMNLAKKFGASIYAACREYVRTHQRSCVLYALEPIQSHGEGRFADVRRIEVSQKFKNQFGTPNCERVDYKHPLADLLPFGKMRGPVEVIIKDLNGVRHRCIGEAFNSTHNIFLLVFPEEALTSQSVWVP
jgi:Zn-dependent peptidase ImmA (M78 family)